MSGAANGQQKRWTLYHEPGTRSSKIVWLLKELDVEVDLVIFKSLADIRSRDGYDKISPLRKVPALVTEHGPLIESGAIAEYIVSTRGGGRLRPSVESPLFQKYLQWTHFGEPSLAAFCAIVKANTVVLPEAERNPKAVHAATQQIKAALSIIEAELTSHGQPYILGTEFSAADIALGHGLRNAKGQNLIAEYPLTDAYISSLQERPAYQQAYIPYPNPTS